MRKFLLTLGFGLLVAGTAFSGGGGNFDDMQQQQMSGKIVVNVDTLPRDNTAVYVAAAATVMAAGLGYLGVRQARKKD